MLVYLFYGLPLLAACLCGLSRPGCGWMPDCTLLFAGAVTQVTMATMRRFASVHSGWIQTNIGHLIIIKNEGKKSTKLHITSIKNVIKM